MANPNLSALTKYVDEQKIDIIGKIYTESKSYDMFNTQLGVKGDTAITLLNTETYFQDGKACTWQTSGSSTLSQRKIEPGLVAVMKSYCDKQMIDYFMNYQMSVAAGKESLPFEQVFIDNEISKIKELKEIAFYQGDKLSSNPNLNKFDGLLKIIDSVSGSTIVGNTTSATGITLANVKTLVDNMYLNIPIKYVNKPDFYIIMGADVYRLYVMALSSLNLYHYNPEATNPGELIIPGTSTKVVAVDGLNGTNRMIGVHKSNVYVGVDGLNDSEIVKFWYSDESEWKLKVIFNTGIQIAFPDEIVRFKLA